MISVYSLLLYFQKKLIFFIKTFYLKLAFWFTILAVSFSAIMVVTIHIIVAYSLFGLHFFIFFKYICSNIETAYYLLAVLSYLYAELNFQPSFDLSLIIEEIKSNLNKQEIAELYSYLLENLDLEISVSNSYNKRIVMNILKLLVFPEIDAISREILNDIIEEVFKIIDEKNNLDKTSSIISSKTSSILGLDIANLLNEDAFNNIKLNRYLNLKKSLE